MATRASKQSPIAEPRRPAPTKVAVPDPAWQPQPVREKAAVHEPVWLVRIVLVLFLVGFAAFLAGEVRSFLQALP
jgi:hypothetical protein